MDKQREQELLQLATMASKNEEDPFMSIATRFIQFMNFMFMKESIPASKYICARAVYTFNTQFSHWTMSKDNWIFEDSRDAMANHDKELVIETNDNIASLYFTYSPDKNEGKIVVTEKELNQFCHIKVEFEITEGIITSLRVKDKISSEE
jgi:hypothetical protein